MKTGKITAKLRDAVPVCLMVNGEEVKRYKNIELPDMLKEVEMTDFHFNVHMDGKITFEIHYEEGTLPEVFPEARTRVSRTQRPLPKPSHRKAQRLWSQRLSSRNPRPRRKKASGPTKSRQKISENLPQRIAGRKALRPPTM